MQILTQKADGQELHNSLFLASDLSAYHLSYSAWSREMHGGKSSSCRDIPRRDGDHMARGCPFGIIRPLAGILVLTREKHMVCTGSVQDTGPHVNGGR